MEVLKRTVEAAAIALDPDLVVEVLGSYRRGAASSGDVDCLITHPRHTQRSGDQYSYVPRLVRSLRRQGFLVDDLVSGPAKYMGVCTTGAPGAHPSPRERSPATTTNLIIVSNSN